MTPLKILQFKQMFVYFPISFIHAFTNIRKDRPNTIPNTSKAISNRKFCFQLYREVILDLCRIHQQFRMKSARKSKKPSTLMTATCVLYAVLAKELAPSFSSHLRKKFFSHSRDTLCSE